MTDRNAPDCEPPIFSAVLTPYRSLGGFEFWYSWSWRAFSCSRPASCSWCWAPGRCSASAGSTSCSSIWAFRANYRAGARLRGGDGDADGADGTQDRPRRRCVRMVGSIRCGCGSTARCTTNSASSGCPGDARAARSRSGLPRPGRKGELCQRVVGRDLSEAKRGPTRAADRPAASPRRPLETRRKSGGDGRSRALHVGDEKNRRTDMLSPDRPLDALPPLAASRFPWPAPPPITTWCAAPSAISAAIGASSPRSRPSPKPPASRPTELHHLFRRWAGLTPKAFLQALTLDGAAALLRDSASVLDATYEVGLSGPGPAARSVRHPRSDVAGRMEVGRRRPDACASAFIPRRSARRW